MADIDSSKHRSPQAAQSQSTADALSDEMRTVSHDVASTLVEAALKAIETKIEALKAFCRSNSAESFKANLPGALAEALPLAVTEQRQRPLHIAWTEFRKVKVKGAESPKSPAPVAAMAGCYDLVYSPPIGFAAAAAKPTPRADLTGLNVQYEVLEMHSGITAKVPTGVGLIIPRGYYAVVRTTSQGLLAGLHVLNGVQSLHHGDLREIKVIMVNAGPTKLSIKPGDVIAHVSLHEVSDVVFEVASVVAAGQIAQAAMGVGTGAVGQVGKVGHE